MGDQLTGSSSDRWRGRGASIVGRETPPSVNDGCRCGSPEIVEGSLCRFSVESSVLVVDR